MPRNSSEKSMLSLQLTLKFYRQNNPNQDFLKRLDSFVKEIQQAIHLDNYKVSSPKIIPKLKEEVQSETGPNVCRPIASYRLKDKIVLSITNRYLTNTFDKLFCNESFAFRSKREINGINQSPTHHDPINEIIQYRSKFDNGSINVSECDMKKFFDTVNHSIIKRTFNQFLKRKFFHDFDRKELENAKRILFDYLESYTFNKNVLPLNKDQTYFDQYRIKHGKFGWVEEELLKYNFYKRLTTAKIGIPQGGALSGFIANLVLHDIDVKVLSHQDGNLLYVRFCDDMMILHPDESKCKSAFEEYLDGLKSKKLVAHIHVNPPFLDKKNFWNEKSKKCYQWNSNGSGSPWIGFVGYEVHFEGHLRVRKNSLQKEMKKQFKVVGDLKNILNNPLCRSPNRTIYESIANRLIGMSVGRVSLWNYKLIKSEMCWVSGFKLLNDNKYSRIQLRRLDNSRNKLLRAFKAKIDRMEQKDLGEDYKVNSRSVQRIFYGYPFSYYYHVISKNK